MKTAPRPARIARNAALIAVPVAMALTAAPANAITVTRVVFAGTAYGSTVNLGGVVHSGKTSVVSLCTTSSGASRSNHAAAVTLPTVGTIGAVDTTLMSSKVNNVSTSSASAATAASTLLNGMITADAIESTATLSRSGASSSYTTGGTVNFVNLTINGQNVPASPPVNQTITIPNVAKVVLNHQFASTSGGLHSWTVQAMVITVGANNPLGLAPGRIVISNSTATLHDPVNSFATGNAYGSTVNVGNTVTSGRTAFTSIGCGGNDGVTHTNTSAGITVNGVVTTGAISSSSTSSDSPENSNVTTTASVANANLAAGVITAGAIEVTAIANRSGGVTSYTGSTANFTNLVVAGTPIPATVPPNTTIPLGIGGTGGSVTLNSITTNSSGVQCYGLILNLPNGTKVVLAAAHAQLTGH